MSRYIDADALIRKIQEGHKFGSLTITELISECPTADVVEVIRCEHCLHWDDEIVDGVYVGSLYHRCDYDGEHKDPCDYCSYAERREDEHTD